MTSPIPGLTPRWCQVDGSSVPRSSSKETVDWGREGPFNVSIAGLASVYGPLGENHRVGLRPVALRPRWELKWAKRRWKPGANKPPSSQNSRFLSVEGREEVEGQLSSYSHYQRESEDRGSCHPCPWGCSRYNRGSCRESTIGPWTRRAAWPCPAGWYTQRQVDWHEVTVSSHPTPPLSPSHLTSYSLPTSNGCLSVSQTWQARRICRTRR